MKTRSSARGEPRRLGNVTLLTLMLCSVVALSLIRGRFAPIVSSIGDAVKSEGLAMVVSKAAFANDVEAGGEAAAAEEKDNDEVEPGTSIKPAADTDGEEEKPKPVCRETSRRSETCEASGDVRVVGRTQTVYAATVDREYKTKPYCRKHDAYALSHVKEWSLRPLDAASPPPACTSNSSSASTAFVLSTGGFTGNPFHDYTDVLIPAFITARRFRSDVQFLVSSYKPWWVSRYTQIFQQLSRYDIIDIDADAEVRCYDRVVVGPAFHRELGVDPSKSPEGYTTADFRRMLRDAFGLERAAAAPTGDHLGFDVRTVEPDSTTDVSKLARLVNSCDVMVGAHGAGLTNMVFLPAGAVMVQVVPYGKLEWLARNTFAEPAQGMEVHYLEYKVQLDETTLSEQYPADHPVLRDPMAIHKQGWNTLKTTYLDKQNLRPHLGRLKNTLMQALSMLPHGREGSH
ncbi:hypothetical protein QOZ80_6BG0473220 [Eleusine coracana subsp. coracana]|nr:hypothetical protein QOZ80_6BG0473220 [Eleusine coracana subsp. coracana]